MHEKKKILIVSAAAKSSIPTIESCVRLGYDIIAAAPKKHCCGFYCNGVTEKLVCPSASKDEAAFIDFLISVLTRIRCEMIIPLGHFETALIARQQESLLKLTKLFISPYDVFQKGLEKIHTMKAAEKVDCPVPKTWFPLEESIEDIALKVTYPVIIKPSISVGARGLSICHTHEELLSNYPIISNQYGDCLIQEYIPQDGMQYKCAIICDENNKSLSGIVYEKLRYYPIKGGSSTLNKSVRRQDILDHSVRVAKYLKWKGPCDFDFITDPRDGLVKLMEINPRFSDTFKMAAVAGLDMTEMLVELAKGNSPKPQFSYRENVYLRFLAGDILWFLKVGPSRWKAKPCFFNFFNRDTFYLMTGKKTIKPAIGYFLENISVLWNKQERKFRLNR